ncbi:hypothetical protein AVEN_183925-1 [Araneus ventricosus]|uniref:PiggyBac transposable element-derived protein domain-containing protein n=1 Tax=Araneus ventricosus TaxID=182803 RepID=A0A4Y2E0A4_ARAVE|nr:hypothetical protein AVEN_183925-1 [Araneus ventricosus]
MPCEPSGYVWYALVYCGTTDPMSGVGHAESVVMALMTKRLNKGHELYTDNYYTSIHLANNLLESKTKLYGILRSNKKYLPKGVVNTKLERGETIAY